MSETAADCVRSPIHCRRGDTGHRAVRWKMGAESCAAEEVGIRSGAAAAHPEPQSLGAWGGDLWGLCILYDVAFHNCPYPQGNGGERGTESANFSCNPPLIKKHRYASDVWSYNFTHRFLLIRKDHFTQKTSLQWCYYPCSPPYPPANSRTPLGLPEISTLTDHRQFNSVNTLLAHLQILCFNWRKYPSSSVCLRKIFS